MTEVDRDQDLDRMVCQKPDRKKDRTTLLETPKRYCELMTMFLLRLTNPLSLSLPLSFSSLSLSLLSLFLLSLLHLMEKFYIAAFFLSLLFHSSPILSVIIFLFLLSLFTLLSFLHHHFSSVPSLSCTRWRKKFFLHLRNHLPCHLFLISLLFLSSSVSFSSSRTKSLSHLSCVHG